MSRMHFTPAETTATAVVAELGEVGADVEGLLGAAVDAAEAAGDEDPDAGQRREPHRRGDRGRAVGAAGDDVGQVADADLGDVGVAAQQLEVVGRQADPRPAVEDGDRRRDRAVRRG